MLSKMHRLVAVMNNMYSLTMANNDNFTVISVTGAHSSVGKTAVCSILLSCFDNFGAIKFTKTDIFSSVSDDPDTIMEKGKDTAIMAEAGAKKVSWIQCPYDGLRDALDIALVKMHGLDGIVVEGNSPVDYMKPDLIIFVIGPDLKIKDSAQKIIKMADMVIVNSLKQPDNPAHILSDMISPDKSQAKVFWINLLKKHGEIDKFRANVEKMLSKKLN